MPVKNDSSVHVFFSYGSNMCSERIRARVASAKPIAVGYVPRRRLAFHKRGADGSGKADAAYTGRSGDRVWGVVFSVSRQQTSVLDEYEPGYGLEQVAVTASGATFTASIYIAQARSIDASLKPFCWYHRYLLHGAAQHRLPATYIEHLKAVETVTDGDPVRLQRNSQLVK